MRMTGTVYGLLSQLPVVLPVLVYRVRIHGYYMCAWDEESVLRFLHFEASFDICFMVFN